jgi:raffinose/stachyose/melibiose transport system permease protein
MKRYTGGTAGFELLLIVTGVIVAFPFYVMLNLAFRSTGDPASTLAPTTRLTLANFVEAWRDAELGRALVNSTIIAVISVVIIVVVSAFAAYAFARVTSRLSSFSYWLLLAGLLLPFQIGMIPLYLTMRDLDLLGTHFAVILFQAGSHLPFSVFLYSGFLRALPGDYEEAAWLDGAGFAKGFFHVVLPLLRPVTGTVIILNGISIWNDLLTPLLYLSGTSNQTVPVALLIFVDPETTNWPVIFAGLAISVAPVLLAYFFLQRNVIKGFASGLKG